MKNELSNRTRLTPNLAESLRDRSKWYTPAQRQMVEGLPDWKVCKLEDAMHDLTPEETQSLVGMTIAQARRSLLGEMTLAEARKVEARLRFTPRARVLLGIA